MDKGLVRYLVGLALIVTLMLPSVALADSGQDAIKDRVDEDIAWRDFRERYEDSGERSLSQVLAWDLDDDNVMYKGQHSEDGWVRIEPKTYQIWKADESSRGEAEFPAAKWWIVLKRVSPGDKSKCQLDVEIGVWDGAEFTPFGIDEAAFPRGLSYLITTIDAKRMPVSEGDWLAFRVYSEKNVRMSTNGATSVLYTSPGAVYPAAELHSVVLLASGLAGLVGCIIWKRRRTLLRS